MSMIVTIDCPPCKLIGKVDAEETAVLDVTDCELLEVLVGLVLDGGDDKSEGVEEVEEGVDADREDGRDVVEVVDGARSSLGS
jgi:hypothetical protein